MAKILLKHKESVLREIPIDKSEITIGRMPTNDVFIDNPAVSGFHAKIFKDEHGRFLLEDQNSLNGTFVNGKRISKVILNNGDDIIIGRHNIIFQIEEADTSTTSYPRRHLGDETVILDSKVRDQILSKVFEQKPPPQEKERIGSLLVIEGSTDKNEYILTDRIVSIGKDKKALIRLKGFFAPHVAALINRRKEGYFITPTGSGKTPRINGKDLAGQYMLKDGDILDIGKLKMQFYFKD